MCTYAPSRETISGTIVGFTGRMLTFFMAGPDLVRWELVALGAHGNGPFRLVIHHAQGSIVEYFPDVAQALMREGELESLLVAARSLSDTNVTWSAIDLQADAPSH
jgi:hypothetical protein